MQTSKRLQHRFAPLFSCHKQRYKDTSWYFQNSSGPILEHLEFKQCFLVSTMLLDARNVLDPLRRFVRCSRRKTISYTHKQDSSLKYTYDCISRGRDCVNWRILSSICTTADITQSCRTTMDTSNTPIHYYH